MTTVKKKTVQRRYFGTDGVRNRANEGSMTPDAILKLAIAAGKYFINGSHRHRVVIGKDTRLSGYMVENALTSGFTAVGMNVTLVGPVPTSAIAMLTRSLRADLGVMISASHNPFYDNGVKFFGPDGYKLSDEEEKQIESLISDDMISLLASPDRIGQAKRLDDAHGRYIEFVKSTFPKGVRLNGLRIVMDCANGAAYKVAPILFWELGAEVIPIGCSPNGYNINEQCGATSVENMRQMVLKFNANIGIALDGDADRVVMVDEKGEIIDGDQLIALIATSWKQENKLSSSTIVGTVMSNLGLERYLQTHNLTLARTPVGDRYVSAFMREHHCNVGGEQSGHIILSDYTSTGDGIIAALQVLAVIVSSGKPASEVVRLFEKVPQVLKNVTFLRNPLKVESPKIQASIKEAEAALDGTGRLLIRESGTEPLIRLMAEGQDEKVLHQLLDQVIATMREEGCLVP